MTVPTMADIEQAKLDMTDINTFVGSSADSFTDNGGNNRLTVAGIINTAIVNAGYIDRGTFTAGAVLSQPNEVLQHSGEYYRWSGAFDKTVTAGSTPTPAGVGGWIAVGDATLRAALASVSSTALIAGVQAKEIAGLFMTPEMFGAIGDGVTNDTLAISNFLTACHLYGVTGKSNPSKRYKITQTVTTTIGSGTLKLRMSGATVVIGADFNLSEVENPILKIRGTGFVDITGLKIEGGNDSLNLLTNTKGVDGLNVAGTSSAAKMKAVRIVNCVSALTPTDFARVYDTEFVTISENIINQPYGHGISFKRCSNVHVFKNKLTGIGSLGGNIATGIQHGIGILGGMSDKIFISENTIDNFTDTGSKCEGCQDVEYSKNIVTNVGKDGIKVQGHPEQTANPDRAIITNNIIRNLYDWRTDGSNCIGIHDARYVVVTGNLCSSDPTVTGATIVKRGISLLNFNSGSQGSAGFINVSNNIIEKCAVHNDTDWQNKYSIHVQRNGSSSGHTMIVEHNICYSYIVAGGGYGSTIVNGNVVGATSDYQEMLFNTDASGIILRGAYCVATGNTVKGFPVGITYFNFTPFPTVANIDISGNSLSFISKCAFDIGAQDNAELDDIEANVNISNNVCSNLTVGNDGAIWVRSGQMKFNNFVISDNTFNGDYRTLVTFKSYNVAHVHKHYSVSNNSEQSSRGDYFETQFVPNCKRVTGDYAKHSTFPVNTMAYRRGDVIWNSIVQGDRPAGWICTDPTTQTWMKFANPSTI